jgi:hypothetical protein
LSVIAIFFFFVSYVYINMNFIFTKKIGVY